MTEAAISGTPGFDSIVQKEGCTIRLPHEASAKGRAPPLVRMLYFCQLLSTSFLLLGSLEPPISAVYYMYWPEIAEAAVCRVGRH